MARAAAASVSLVRSATFYQWLVDREERAMAAGGTLPWSPGQSSYDGTAARLAALRRCGAVDVPLSSLPPWARVGEPVHWWRRAVVSSDGAVTFYDDNGAAWLEEAGL